MVRLENQPSTCYNLSMSFFTSLGIVLTAMLILAFLQLTPGVFMLFRHYTSGKFSRSKVSSLTLFFLLGVETVAAALLISSLLFSNLFFLYSVRPETTFLSWALAGILAALAVIMIIGYYRRGSGTRLFIPRRCAAALDLYARTVDSRSDAFVLGALSGVLEIPFTLPLFLVSSIALTHLSVTFSPNLLLAFGLVIVPLALPLAITFRYHAGYNLADLMRSRARDKNFIRFILALGYAIIAAMFIYYGVLS